MLETVFFLFCIGVVAILLFYSRKEDKEDLVYASGFGKYHIVPDGSENDTGGAPMFSDLSEQTGLHRNSTSTLT